MNPTLLKDLILAGHRVACKTNEWMRKVFLFVRWDWRFAWTGLYDSIEWWLSEGLSESSYPEQAIQEDFTWEYKIVTPLPQLPKVWDAVEVLEICRELPWFDGWDDNIKNMVWKRWEVKEVTSFWDIWLEYKDGYKFYFSPRQAAKCKPYVKTASDKLEVIELNGKKYIELKE